MPTILVVKKIFDWASGNRRNPVDSSKVDSPLPDFSERAEYFHSQRSAPPPTIDYGEPLSDKEAFKLVVIAIRLAKLDGCYQTPKVGPARGSADLPVVTAHPKYGLRSDSIPTLHVQLGTKLTMVTRNGQPTLAETNAESIANAIR